MEAIAHSFFPLSRLRERVGERAGLARAHARDPLANLGEAVLLGGYRALRSQGVCPLPNPLPQTGEGTDYEGRERSAFCGESSALTLSRRRERGSETFESDRDLVRIYHGARAPP